MFKSKQMIFNGARNSRNICLLNLNFRLSLRQFRGFRGSGVRVWPVKAPPLNDSSIGRERALVFLAGDVW